MLKILGKELFRACVFGLNLAGAAVFLKDFMDEIYKYR